MRILHLVHRYHPARGGAEMHMQKFSAYLAAAGHDVTVVTTDALDFERFWDPDRRKLDILEEEHLGVHIQRFPIRHLPLSQLQFPAIRHGLRLLSSFDPIPVSWLARLSRFAPWVPDLYDWAETPSAPFDVIGGMAITFDPFIKAGFDLARRSNAPFVCYPLTHLGAGSVPGRDAVSRFYTMRHQTALVTASDAVAAQTRAEKDFYIDLGMAPERLQVIGPGISPEEVIGGDQQQFRAKYQLAGPILLSIGAMSLDKGTIQVVESVRQLWQEGRSLNLVLIGEVLSSFKSYLDGLPVHDRKRIQLLGSVPETEKRDALAAADLFALPSRTDSFGMVYLEAWLYEVPVIGARTWGVMDIIQDGYDGLLVPFGDSGSLAEAIAYLLDHPAEARLMGERGRLKVLENHTWDRKCRQVHDLYQSLVEQTGLER